MALAVLDASLVIGFLERRDPSHDAALARLRALRTVERRICAVTLSEVLVEPLRTGRGEAVERDLTRLSIAIVAVDLALARTAALVRARSRLRLPDAYVLATALQAQAQGHEGVRVETFDAALEREAVRLIGAGAT